MKLKLNHCLKPRQSAANHTTANTHATNGTTPALTNVFSSLRSFGRRCLNESRTTRLKSEDDVPTKLSNGLDQITNALGQLTCRTTGIKDCIDHAKKKRCNSEGEAYRLPVEIWSDIFLLASSEDTVLGPIVATGDIESLYLTCRRFYDIIVSDPRFWCYISTDMNPDKIKRQLLLARDHPLKVNIDSHRLDETRLLMFIERKAQWRFLNISFRSPRDGVALATFMQNHPLDLNELENLNMHSYNVSFPHNAWTFRNIKTFSGAPDMLVPNSLPHVEHLSLYGFYSYRVRGLLMLLRTTRHLRKLEFDFESFSLINNDFCEETVELPRLEELNVTWDSPEPLIFCRPLLLPNLRKLTQHVHSESCVVGEQWWRAILHNVSYPLLTDIVLEMRNWREAPTYPRSLGTLVLENPSIQTLTLQAKEGTVSMVSVMDDLCDAIGADDGHTLKLRRLTFPENTVLRKYVEECLEEQGVTLSYCTYIY